MEGEIITGDERAKSHRPGVRFYSAIAACFTLLRSEVFKGPAFILLLSSILSHPAVAGGGYFGLGYGHLGKQMGGAVTAVGGDAYAGASNPAKLTAAGDQLEIGVEFLNPNRKVKRRGATGPASIYNFSSTSRNPLYVVPDFAYSRQLDDSVAVGIAVYANGGLNNEYTTTTGVPGSSSNPEACGDEPGNFLTGCGHAGFDLSQVIFAPTIAWEIAPGHSVGVSPLVAMQRFESFGLQGFAAFSKYPNKLTNNGHEIAWGGGVRVGWYGEIKPWLSVGAAYATKIYMQKFDRYRGLFAEGTFDVPANYNIGAAFKPDKNWVVALDVQRIEYGEVRSISNGVLNSLTPGGPLIGTSSGNGFGWSRNQTNYKLGLSYSASPQLTLRGGYDYGKKPNKDDLDAVSIGVFMPNSVHRAGVGLSWKTEKGSEVHVGYTHYFNSNYSGPSAIFPGATESLTAYVNLLHIAWTAHY
jgi:long-chain fatty acid transport protein